ncbi:MAG: efflux RND transporter periplasmic adaptor subunit [Thermodesulfobacteria bacterium]|nr:efflux RND transporter periplasmic adaptor subunit [Thermodesulfobacteriota bacterium]
MKKGLTLLIVFFVFILSSCNKKEKHKFVPHGVAKVKKGTVYLVVSATGAVKPQVGAQVKVGARISGKVEKLFVTRGDKVRAGELIAIIEHKDLEAQVKKAEAIYKQAIEKLEEIKHTYPLKIKAQEDKVSALKIELEEAKKEYQKNLKLFEKKLISEIALDRLKRDYLVKLKEYEAAEKELEELKTEFGDRLAQAAFQVKAAKNDLELAKQELSYAYIYAPISGVVSDVTTQQGETVVAGLNAPTFITVIDLSKLQVDCYVDETDIGKIKPGDKAVFTVDAYPDKKFRAIVKTIYPGAIIKNNVVFYDVVLKILDPYENYLRPEMTAQVKIFAGKRTGVLVVPSRAVKIDAEGNYYVMVKRGNKWVKRIVKVGWESQGKTQIISGLKLGEEVGLW